MLGWVALTLSISCLAIDDGDRARVVSAADQQAAAADSDNAATSLTVAVERNYRQQGWWITQTTNFRVCSLVGHGESTKIARHCEALRVSIRELWLPDADEVTWTSRCDIIAHRSDAGYIQAVGRGGAQTAGSALIEIEEDAVVVRRIDLRAASPEALESALAHELTHVILADRFTDKVLPRWADEGMATLADSHSKQKLHWQDLQHGLRSRKTLAVAELVALHDYPPPHRMDVFYGQSVSLVSFLLTHGEQGQFVQFIEAAIDQGYDRALQEVYQIAGVRELERRWLGSLRGGAVEFVSRTPKGFPVIGVAEPAITRDGT